MDHYTELLRIRLEQRREAGDYSAQTAVLAALEQDARAASPRTEISAATQGARR